MNILVAEDDKDSRISICEFLCDLGHRVIGCENGQEALEHFINGNFSLVLTDIKMPRMTGIELMRRLNNFKNERNFNVVLFTGYGDMESAIEALRNGARDYLLKPINIEELAAIVERVAEEQVTLLPNIEISKQFIKEVRKSRKEAGCDISCINNYSAVMSIGEIGVFSDKTENIFRQACKLHEDRDIPVLIEGETGTGKEVVARIIHYCCADTEDPFVDINCAVLTPGLFESELFGYEAGAYTGALTRGSKGKIDLAAGGTLFLDEIGELSIDLQAKLLRVIQEKEFYRVGGLKKIKTDVRLICATNVDLEKKVNEGLFRSDLFYRLNVGRIVLPPLRERKEEIMPLAQMFLKEFTQKKGKKFVGISDKAAEMLVSSSWPGNVRELRNTIEWAVFMHDDTQLKPAHLGIINISKTGVDLIREVKELSAAVNLLNISLPQGELPLEKYIDEIVLQALKMHNENKAKTARYLGISRRSLYYRLERLKEVTGE